MAFSGLFKYGALSAKLKSMSGKLLNRDNFYEMSMLKTVGEAVAYLKNNINYFELLKNVNETQINRDALERLLNSSLFVDYKKIMLYIRSNDRKFTVSLLVRYEVNLLKNVVRLYFANESVHNVIANVPSEFANLLSFNIQKIEGTTSVEGLIEALEGTGYSKVLKMLYQRGKDPDLFDIEVNLDKYFFGVIWETLEKCLEGKNKDDIARCIGSEADVLNLLWIYRCKKYYKMPSELIYGFLIPIHYKLSDKELMEIITSQGEEAVIEAASNTKYGRVFREDKNSLYEKALLSLIHEMFKKTMVSGIYNISNILGYLYAKELEIENISSVVEGIRYNLRSEEIMEYVI